MKAGNLLTKNFSHQESPTMLKKNSSLDLSGYFNLGDGLASYTNMTESDVHFDDSFWSQIQSYSWKEEAAKLLRQPAYIVTLILCFIAIMANVISIVAILHIRTPLTMHLRLIINLAASDIGTIISLLMNIMNQIFNRPFALEITSPSKRLTNGCIYATVSAINNMTLLISLFNLLAMAVDHYIAIMLPLSYYRIMSVKHGHILIVFLWVLAAIGGFSNFMFGMFGYKEKQEMFNYCEYIMYDSYHAEYLVFSVIFLCLCGITFVYLRIYCVVLTLQTQCSVPDDVFHNKKAVATTVLIIGTFCVCWLPNCIFQITMISQLYVNNSTVFNSVDNFLVISKYLYILQVTSCLLDPIIYAVRLSVVKCGYRIFLNKLKTFHCRKTIKTHPKSRSSSIPKSYQPTMSETQPMVADTVIPKNSSSRFISGEVEPQSSTFRELEDRNQNGRQLKQIALANSEMQLLVDCMTETKV